MSQADELTQVPEIRVKKRIIWVDICRILAFIFIALLHSNKLFHDNPLAARSGVGLFFLLAAYFSSDKPASRIILRAIKIMLACLFWRAVVSLCLGKLLSDFSNLFYLIMYDLGTLWFLRDLAICMVCSVFFRKLSTVYQVVLLVVFAGFLTEWCKIDPPESTIYALLFYNAGIALKRSAECSLSDALIPKWLRDVNSRCNFPLFVLSLGLLLFYTFCFSINEYAIINIAIVALLMILCSFYLGQANSGPCFTSAVRSIGEAGFFFYVTHAMVLRLFVSIHLKVTNEFPAALSCFIAVCMHFAICAVVGRFLMKRNRLIDALFFAR